MSFKKDFLIPYRKIDKWGFYSFEEKRIVIPCEFSNAYPYHYVSSLAEKCAIVEKTNFWGAHQFYINQNGEHAINLKRKYAWVDEFYYLNLSYYAKVALRTISGIKTGIIDKFGNYKFKCNYDDCGKLTIKDSYTKVLPVKRNNKWGIVDIEDKIIVPFKFDFIGDFNEHDLAICHIGLNMNLKFKRENKFLNWSSCYGFIDKKGHVITEQCLFTWVKEFSEGLAAVQIPSTSKFDRICGKWGFINYYGDEAIPFKFSDAKSFSNGLAAVRESHYLSDGKYGFIDNQGNLIIDYKYDNAFNFSRVSYDPDLFLAAIKLGGKWGFIDKNGNLVIECKYDEVYSFNNEIAAVKVNDKWGFINLGGDLIIDFKYSWIWEVQKSSNPLEPYSKRDEYLIDRDLIKVSSGKQTGFIDKTGVEYWEN